MKRAFGIALMLVLLPACGVRPLNPDVQATASAEAMQTALNPTDTPTALPTATPAPAPTQTPAPTSTPECESPQGRVEQTVYPGVIVDQDIPVRIFLPPCYEMAERRYPVLYLLHGKPLEVADWYQMGAAELAGLSMEAGIWPTFLIVMPIQPEPIFTNSDGGPWSYEAEFLDGLLPWVDGHYRTEDRPEGRALAGISRGGIWALEISFRHADQIGAMAALSPALAVNNPREDYDPFNLAVSGRTLPSRIYLAAGQEDWARADTERLHGVLQSVGADARLVIVPGTHGSDLWEGLLEDVIGYLALGWVSVD
ncbi:MAG: alpha/beta hydrolase-fold protein [Anaerolineales bacterium]